MHHLAVLLQLNSEFGYIGVITTAKSVAFCTSEFTVAEFMTDIIIDSIESGSVGPCEVLTTEMALASIWIVVHLHELIELLLTNTFIEVPGFVLMRLIIFDILVIVVLAFESPPIEVWFEFVNGILYGVFSIWIKFLICKCILDTGCILA